jgi:hypothetical protein
LPSVAPLSNSEAQRSENKRMTTRGHRCETAKRSGAKTKEGRSRGRAEGSAKQKGEGQAAGRITALKLLTALSTALPCEALGFRAVGARREIKKTNAQRYLLFFILGLPIFFFFHLLKLFPFPKFKLLFSFLQLGNLVFI